MAAKLPQRAMKESPRKLSDLRLGETGYLWYVGMYVTSTGEAYLVRNTDLQDRGPRKIKVSRDDQGYHVTLIDESVKWTAPEDSPVQSILDSDIPVATIGEDYDPSVDSCTQLQKMAEIMKKLELMGGS